MLKDFCGDWTLDNKKPIGEKIRRTNGISTSKGLRSTPTCVAASASAFVKCISIYIYSVTLQCIVRKIDSNNKETGIWKLGQLVDNRKMK